MVLRPLPQGRSQAEGPPCPGARWAAAHRGPAVRYPDGNTEQTHMPQINLDTWQCFVPVNSFQYFSWSILEELLPQALQKMYINTWKTQDSQPLFSTPKQAARLQPLPFNREKPSSSKPCGKWLQHISLTTRGQPSTRIQNSICRLLFKFLFKIREKEVLTIISVG